MVCAGACASECACTVVESAHPRFTIDTLFSPNFVITPAPSSSMSRRADTVHPSGTKRITVSASSEQACLECIYPDLTSRQLLDVEHSYLTATKNLRTSSLRPPTSIYRTRPPAPSSDELATRAASPPAPPRHSPPTALDPPAERASELASTALIQRPHTATPAPSR